MIRVNVPKKVSEAVLSEYSHRCAECGQDRPHLHHIDEDPSNNDPLNLLPLCPNCHLTDQHNPSHRVEVPKLKLFRRHKDPAILKPQFHPLYKRQEFLDSVSQGVEPVSDLEAQVRELVKLVAAMEMGEFYSKRIHELIGPATGVFISVIGGTPDSGHDQQVQKRSAQYRARLIENRDTVKALLVEMLRFQKWAHSPAE